MHLAHSTPITPKGQFEFLIFRRVPSCGKPHISTLLTGLEIAYMAAVFSPFNAWLETGHFRGIFGHFVLYCVFGAGKSAETRLILRFIGDVYRACSAKEILQGGGKDA
jgi:hypothetical protein